MHALKSDNRLCYNRDVRRRQKIHREKLRNMKSTNKSNAKFCMDNTAPVRYRHLELNLKRQQLNIERYGQIQRENHLLMSKMYSIMKQKSSGEGTMEFRPGMRLNSNQGPMVDCYLSPKSLYPGHAVKHDSLNRESRRREYVKIMQENLSILRRIQERKPVYQRKQWAKERESIDGYLKNIRVDNTSGYLNCGARSGSPMRTGKTKGLPSLQDGRLTAPARMTKSRSSPGPSSSFLSASGDYGSQSLQKVSVGARGGLTLQDFQFGGWTNFESPTGGSLRPATTASPEDTRPFQNGVMATQTRVIGKVHLDLAVIEVRKKIASSSKKPSTASSSKRQICTSGVAVAAFRNDQVVAELQLSVQNLVSLSALAGDESLNEALSSLPPIDELGNYKCITQAFDDNLLNQLSVCILNAVESQVVEGDVVLSLVASFNGRSFMEGDVDGDELQPEVTGENGGNEDIAATTIQNKHRQKQAKAKVQELKDNTKAATSIQNKHRQNQAKARVDDIKKTRQVQNEAATSIQSKHRQKQANVRVNMMMEKRANDENVIERNENDAQAAVCIQNKHRQIQAQVKVEKVRREHKAATSIQSKSRQKDAMKQVNVKKKEAKAATRIQNVQRGKIAKKTVDAKRTDAKAATTIQNKHRQKQAKNAVSAKRAELAKSSEVELVQAKESVQSSGGGDDYDDDFDSSLSTSLDSMDPPTKA